MLSQTECCSVSPFSHICIWHFKWNQICIQNKNTKYWNFCNRRYTEQLLVYFVCWFFSQIWTEIFIFCIFCTILYMYGNIHWQYVVKMLYKPKTCCIFLEILVDIWEKKLNKQNKATAFCMLPIKKNVIFRIFLCCVQIGYPNVFQKFLSQIKRLYTHLFYTLITKFTRHFIVPRIDGVKDDLASCYTSVVSKLFFSSGPEKTKNA